MMHDEQRATKNERQRSRDGIPTGRHYPDTCPDTAYPDIYLDTTFPGIYPGNGRMSG
jgi:hypothetical protein